MLTLEETKKKLIEIYATMNKPVDIYVLLYKLYEISDCNRSITRMALVDLLADNMIEVKVNEREGAAKQR